MPPRTPTSRYPHKLTEAQVASLHSASMGLASSLVLAEPWSRGFMSCIFLARPRIPPLPEPGSAGWFLMAAPGQSRPSCSTHYDFVATAFSWQKDCCLQFWHRSSAALRGTPGFFSQTQEGTVEINLTKPVTVGLLRLRTQDFTGVPQCSLPLRPHASQKAGRQGLQGCDNRVNAEQHEVKEDSAPHVVKGGSQCWHPFGFEAKGTEDEHPEQNPEGSLHVLRTGP